jgi:threonine dehydratase
VLIAVGGGGLIGGVAAWFRNRVKVIGVEPELAPTLARALEAGHPLDVETGGLAADSLGATQVGALMFPIARQYVERVVLVKDEDIAKAQTALWRNLRVVAEPGGAAALAAVLSRAYQVKPGERVGVVVCGGNTELSKFPA